MTIPPQFALGCCLPLTVAPFFLPPGRTGAEDKGVSACLVNRTIKYRRGATGRIPLSLSHDRIIHVSLLDERSLPKEKLVM